MTSSRPSAFLRNALLLDAVASGVLGLLMLAAAGMLEGLLAVPSALMRYAGLSLLPWAAFLVWLTTRERVPTPLVWAVIVGNVVWAADSVLLLLTGWLEPAALGYAFVVAQALAVAVFAELQYLGLRRSSAAPA